MTGITWENEIFGIKAGERLFRCHYLIGADGTNSIVNRTFNIVEKDLYGFAIETNCPVSKENIGNFEMSFDLGTVPNGYLWVFPKDQYICVGAYTTDKKMKNIRKNQRAYHPFQLNKLQATSFSVYPDRRCCRLWRLLDRGRYLLCVKKWYYCCRSYLFKYEF